MKFTALLKKDLPAIRIWVILIMAVFSFSLVVVVSSYSRMSELEYFNAASNPPCTEIGDIYRFFLRNINFSDMEILLIWFALGFGVVLGFWHFWMPKIQNTWAFNVFRPASRARLLTARISAGIAGITAAILIPWSLYFMYAFNSEVGGYSPFIENYYESLGYILMAVSAYAVTAMTAVDNARWYRTRFLPAAFALFMLPFSFSGLSLGVFIWMQLLLAAGFTMLLYKKFLTAEF
jgi:hypothetical protein